MTNRRGVAADSKSRFSVQYI